MFKLVALALLGQSPFYIPPPSSVSGTGSSVSAGACSGTDSVVFDNNGVAGCQKLSDVAPQGMLLRPQPAFAGGTQTAANLILTGGQDETKIAIDGADPSVSCAGDNDTVTMTIIDSNGATVSGGGIIVAEGTDWNAVASVATTCANLATAVTTKCLVSGYAYCTASCTSPDVRISFGLATASMTLAESTAGCTTVTVGTRGTINAYSAILAQDGTAALPGYSFISDPDTGLYRRTTNTLDIVLGGSSVVRLQASTVAIGNYQFTFAAGSPETNSPDVGIGRSAAGILKTTNGTTGNATAMIMPIQSAAVPAAPATCDATTFGMMQVVNDTNDTAATTVCYCGQTNDDSTYDWLTVAADTACPHY